MVSSQSFEDSSVTMRISFKVSFSSTISLKATKKGRKVIALLILGLRAQIPYIRLKYHLPRLCRRPPLELATARLGLARVS